MKPALLAVLTALLLAPSAVAADKKAIWGPVKLPGGRSAFPVYEDLGVRFLQLQLNWRSTAPTRPAAPLDPSDPAYVWPGSIDYALAKAAPRGIEVVLMIKDSPAWANGGRRSAWAPDPSSYADFVTAASRRYPAVRRWMIWGETNRHAVFRPLPTGSDVGPRTYARLLAAGYHAVKKEEPDDLVIGGNTFSFGAVRPHNFARWMRLPNGRPAPLDEWGHNPFTPRFPDLSNTGYEGAPGARDFSDIDTFSRELHRIYRRYYPRFQKRGPKLWLSEFTISSDRGNREFPFYVSRTDQARWLTAAYRIANRNSWIAGLGWIPLLDEPAGDPQGTTTGLMTWKGKRKPAYYAYRRVR